MKNVVEQVKAYGIEAALVDLAASTSFRLELASGAVSGEEGEATVEETGDQLVVSTAIGDEVVLRREFTRGQAIYRQWLEVTPATATDVRLVEPVRVSVVDRLQVHTVSGVQQQGGWRAQEGMYRSFHLESALLDVPFHTESGLRSTWYESPWAALTGHDSYGIVTMLEYGGRWAFDVTGGAAAFAPVGIVPAVAAGETWVSPAVWVGVFRGDLDEAAAVTHRFMRETVIPATADDFPWVQYNTWFSYYCDLDEAKLLAEADIAAELGIEVFYVDAGWWVGNPRRRDRFSSGLGNWRENTEKFPHGLKWFADQIRAKGMHFGIWVEPERVDMRTVHTGSWRSDWIASDQGRYIRCEWPSDTDTAWLCYGHEATQEWAAAWISDLAQSLGVRWLKWDSNYWGVCTNPEHTHGAGDGEAAQIEGVYKVMDALRERFPDLVIENCAGGATRMDYAIARHTHCAWMNDASEPHYRTRFHTAGATYIYPPEMLNAWITESEHENVNRQELPDDVWRAVIRSRMIGAMGFSNQLVTWSERMKQIAREEIAFYKHEIRAWLKSSRVYHLVPQPEIPSAELLTPDVWEALQVAAGDGSASVIFGFRNVSPVDAIEVKPKGLDAGAMYSVVVDGGDARTVSGAELAQGIRLETALLASVVVTIRREA
jgi:alpha-galactosidase